MSPRAAWRLETLGFSEVYDYVAGKQDWVAYGLPREGTAADQPSAGELARRDVPTARLDEKLQDVRARIGDWDTALVVNDERVVLGRLGRQALASDADVSVEEAMRPGSGTVRPNVTASAAVERMERDGLHTLLVTTPDGRLIGVLYKEDAEEAIRP